MGLGNEWLLDASHVLSTENLARIRASLERDHIIVEHMHYAGGSGKDTLLFADFDEFLQAPHTQDETG